MIRWFIVNFLALVLISWFSPLLQRLGLGKLPGDLNFRLFGRDWFVPLSSTILLSLAASAQPAEPAPTMTTSKWFTPNRS